MLIVCFSDMFVRYPFPLNNFQLLIRTKDLEQTYRRMALSAQLSCCAESAVKHQPTNLDCRLIFPYYLYF